MANKPWGQQPCSAGEAEASAAKLAELSGELARQQELVARLEEDLLAAERAAGSRPPPGEAAEGGGTISPTGGGLVPLWGGGTCPFGGLSLRGCPDCSSGLYELSVARVVWAPGYAAGKLGFVYDGWQGNKGLYSEKLTGAGC